MSPTDPTVGRSGVSLDRAAIDKHAAAIYDRSKAEALASLPDQLGEQDGELWVLCGKRASAMSFYAYEFGVRWIDVRCTRAWMRVDLAAIRDVANQLAYDAARGYDASDIAYTWEGDGFVWAPCRRTDAGATGFWHCEERL